MKSTLNQQFDRDLIVTVLNRLKRGETVALGTSITALEQPRTFTVHRIADEVLAQADDPDHNRSYYRIYLRGPQGGKYVVHPTAKPDGKGDHALPELFHVLPSNLVEADQAVETTEGTIQYLKLEEASPADP